MLFFVAVVAVFSCGRKNETNPPYLNPALEVEKRIDDLLKRMTLQEKVAQLQFVFMGENTDSLDVIRPGHVFGIGCHYPAVRAAQLYNQLQENNLKKSRLKIPFFGCGEGEYGYVGYGSTSFPQSIALASSWDPELVEKVAVVIATECKARGVRQIYAPVVNIGRDIRWGRFHECYGEDPYLTSRIAVSYVKALQANGVIACPKHFAANIGMNGKFSGPVHFSERLLREIYFPAFKACVVEAGALCIMAAYNTLDGIPCGVNRWLLTDVLRKEWNFRGCVSSDGNALPMIYESHLTANSKEEVAAQAIRAGCDMDASDKNYYNYPLLNAIKKGMVKEKEVDESVRRVLRCKFVSGLFDNPLVDTNVTKQVNDCAEHRKMALEAAEQCIVLLKNENHTLPFQKSIKSIAVLGPLADELLGTHYAGYGRKEVTVLEGIQKKFPHAKVYYAKGAELDFYGMPPIESKYLSTVINGIKLQGLKGEYFNNKELKGNPVFVRNDKMVDFNWKQGSPDPHIPADNFSVRWTGMLTSPETGFFQIGGCIDDGVRIWLGDSLIVDSWTGGSKRIEHQEVKLEKGRSYPIKMEYYEGTYTAHAQLCWTVDLFSQLPSALEAAKKADVSIIVVGTFSMEGQDRAFTDLSASQEKLIKEVAKLGKPMAVVLHSGNVITMSRWIKDVPAIIESWYPGEEGGTAVANILFGDANPSAKLPCTVPKELGQVPLNYNHLPEKTKTDGHIIATFLGCGNDPQFAFGHGLSYTDFKYSELRLSKKIIGKKENVSLTFNITNTGNREGAEVAQLYMHDKIASIARPVKQLIDFKKIWLKPGETKQIIFIITPEKLSMYDINMNWVVEPGEFELMVGSSSEDIRLKEVLTVK